MGGRRALPDGRPESARCRLPPDLRQRVRDAGARRWVHPDRTHQHARVGRHGDHRAAAVGTDPQPVGTRSFARRIVGRFGRRRRRRHRPRRPRQRHLRIDPDPGRDVRCGRPQADAWSCRDERARYADRHGRRRGGHPLGPRHGRGRLVALAPVAVVAGPGLGRAVDDDVTAGRTAHRGLHGVVQRIPGRRGVCGCRRARRERARRDGSRRRAGGARGVLVRGVVGARQDRPFGRSSGRGPVVERPHRSTARRGRSRTTHVVDGAGRRRGERAERIQMREVETARSGSYTWESTSSDSE